MKVRDNDVLLPTTLVGAYPRQVFMQGPVFGAGVYDKEFPTTARASCTAPRWRSP